MRQTIWIQLQWSVNPKDCYMGDFIYIRNNIFPSTTMTPIYILYPHNNNGLVEIFTNKTFKYAPNRINYTFQTLIKYFEMSHIYCVTFNPDIETNGHCL